MIIRGWYNRPVVASVIVGSVPPHPEKDKNNFCMKEEIANWGLSLYALANMIRVLRIKPRLRVC
jgi:hypothetical protein